MKLMPQCVIGKRKSSHTAVVEGVHILLCEIDFMAYKQGMIDKDMLRKLALVKLIKRWVFLFHLAIGG